MSAAPRTFVLVRHLYGGQIRLVIASAIGAVVAEITPRRALQQLAQDLLETALRDLAH
jgi:hypothetical protein